MKIIVLGATGNVGSRFARWLQPPDSRSSPTHVGRRPSPRSGVNAVDGAAEGVDRTAGDQSGEARVLSLGLR